MQAYCVKCRSKKEMKDPKNITMKNGKPATQGVCPSCGTKIAHQAGVACYDMSCPKCGAKMTRE